MIPLDEDVYFWLPSAVFQTVYNVTVLILYFVRRRYMPIRVMFPWTSIIANSFGSAFSILNCIGNYHVIEVISPFLLTILKHSFVSLAIDMYILITFNLFLAFNKTQDQLALLKTDPTHADSVRHNLRLTIALQSRKVQIAFIMAMTTLQMLAQTIYCIARPELFEPGSLTVELPARNTLILILSGKHILSVLLLLSLSWRLRIVVDAHGIKRTLKRIGWGTLAGLISYMIVKTIRRVVLHGSAISSFRAEDAIILLTCVYIITVAITIPMWRTFQSRTLPSPDDQISHDEFERFLRTPSGFEAFKSQLAREFALENILFWRECDEFRRYSGSSRERAAKATKIFEQYLAADAPLEVNLPSSMNGKYRSLFRPDTTRRLSDMWSTGANEPVAADEFPGISPDTFVDAAASILSLMESSLLGRFKAEHSIEWKAFVKEDRENFLLTNRRKPDLK